MNKTKFFFGLSKNGYDILGTKEDIKAFQNYLENLFSCREIFKKEGKSIK